MKPVKTIDGIAYPFGAKNIDTDVIISSEWLKTISRSGLGEGAFAIIRQSADNVFDDQRYRGATILIAGDNFGCGSSREHAAWAIADMGVRAIVAPSFSDIFSSNAFKNGIVTVCLVQAQIDRLMVLAAQSQSFCIDLEQQMLTAAAEEFSFEYDAFRKHCLLNGLDEVGLSLQQDEAIAQFEASCAESSPWLAR